MAILNNSVFLSRSFWFFFSKEKKIALYPWKLVPNYVIEWMGLNFDVFFGKFVKISWIGPWFSKIDWCDGHWCGSTYMVERLSGVSSKTGKKCIFVFLSWFCAYVRQLHDHISWATSISFASINPTYPRTNQQNFLKRILRIGDFEQLILIFFFQKNKIKLLYTHEN